MTFEKALLRDDAVDEISVLIDTLHETGERLEKLTAGEVDAVANRRGETFLLRRAQDQLRHGETMRHAAILNALPAHIALLDTRGVNIRRGLTRSWLHWPEAGRPRATNPRERSFLKTPA